MKLAVLYWFRIDQFDDRLAFQAVAFVKADGALGFLLGKPLGNSRAVQPDVPRFIAYVGNAGRKPSAVDITLIDFQFTG